jgi:hypothetical protein
MAVLHVQTLRAREFGWVVDGDIATCFDSLDHDLLMGFLKHKVRDGRVLDLLQAWLDAGIMQAGPPQNVDMQSATRVESAKNFAKKGFEWVMDSIGAQADPYTPYEYYDVPPASYPGPQPGVPNSTSLYPDRDAFTASMRRNALRRIISSGLMLGVGFVRARASGIFSKAGTVLKTVASSPAGRRLIKRSAMTTGGLAGLAAAAAVTAYLLNRKAGRAPAGVLQGSPLSPLLANIYLHPFDVNVTGAGHQLARFADDWVILCPSQEKAEVAYNDALRALARLHLKANLEKTRILEPGQQLEWLGVVIK